MSLLSSSVSSALPSTKQHGQWSGGQLLTFSGLVGPTDFRHGLVARTGQESGSLILCLPHTGKIDLCNCENASIEVGGDFFIVYCESGRREGVFVDAHHLLIHGICNVEGDGYEVRNLDGFTLIGVAEYFDERLTDPASCRKAMSVVWDRADWLRGLGLPKIEGDESAALEKAALMMRSQIMAPEGRIKRRWSTPDRWPHSRMWLWDSVFHAIGWRHFDLPLAQEILEAVFDVQKPNGFVPHMASPFEASDITQPPVLAYGILKLVESGAPLSWVERLLPRLMSYLAWNETNRDTDGNGLLEWYIEANEHCRSGESGMDNSPRFDGAIQLDAVDLNAFMANEYKSLAELMGRLGRDEQKAELLAKCARYNRLINQLLWNDATGFYHDYDPEASQQTPVLTARRISSAAFRGGVERTGRSSGRTLGQPRNLRHRVSRGVRSQVFPERS